MPICLCPLGDRDAVSGSSLSFLTISPPNNPLFFDVLSLLPQHFSTGVKCGNKSLCSGCHPWRVGRYSRSQLGVLGPTLISLCRQPKGWPQIPPSHSSEDVQVLASDGNSRGILSHGCLGPGSDPHRILAHSSWQNHPPAIDPQALL